MKKNLKSLGCVALAVIGTLATKNASAQFELDQLSFGAGLGYTKHSQNIGGSLSYNIRANYAIDEKSIVAVHFNSQLPFTMDLSSYANARNSMTVPSSVPVSIEQKISFYNVSVDFQRYFVEDIEETFGVYGLAGLGLSFANVSYTIGSYDETNYQLGSSNAYTDESFQGFMINLGLGANYNLSDKVALFGEGRVALPANKQNNVTIENPIPFNYCLQVGARFNVFN